MPRLSNLPRLQRDRTAIRCAVDNESVEHNSGPGLFIRVPELRGYLPQLEDRKIARATHYTILLGQRGATQIANLIVEPVAA